MPSEQAARPLVLVVDADPSLVGLLEQWLEDEGYRVHRAQAHEPLAALDAELVILDVGVPRRDMPALLERIGSQLPGVPILALSANFFAGIDSCGAVARALGVAGVLPMPLSQAALLNAVRRLLPAPA